MRLLAACGLLLALGVPPGVLAAGDANDEGPTFSVSRFVVVYRDAHPDQPDLEQILPLTVRLGALSSGFVAPRDGLATTPVAIGVAGDALPYHASAIGAVTHRIAAAVRAQGLLGVYVAPDEGQLDVAAGRDLRAAGDTDLRLLIDTARVRSVRTIARGDRISSQWQIDNPAHRRIREMSPIQPTGAVREGTSDLIDEELLDDYLFRLNRHPGRRVDASLAPADDGSGAAVDFLVSEAKPWHIYAVTANTGTESTAVWQTRIGFIHNQLTDKDDIFGLEITTGGSPLISVTASYEAPWFAATRPWWWNTPSEGPRLLSWLDRSKLPWWGNDDLRWRVWGSFTDFSADQVSGVDDVEGQDWTLGGRLVYSAFQHHAFFLDIFGGAEMRGVVVENQGGLGEASQFLFLPQAGIQGRRVNEVSSFFADVTVEGNVGSENACDEAGASPLNCIDALGLVGTDARYAVVLANLGFSQFLEPLFNPKGWEDPSTRWSSTLAHEIAIEARGQYAFGFRLIPQAKQVVGGLYSVRGYEPSTSSADDVAIGTVEYRYHIPHSFPIQREPIDVPLLGDFRLSPQQVYGRPDWDLILRGFVDAAYTHRNKQLRDSAGESLEAAEFLVGAGAGIELVILNNLRARVDWATALRDSEEQQGTGNNVRPLVEKGDFELHFLFSVMY